MPGPFESLGFSVTDIVAGFLGGVVRIFTFGSVKPFEAAGSVCVGAITANYLAPAMASYIHLPEAPSGFIVGLVGMQIVLSITAALKLWRPNLPKGLPDDGKPPELP